LKAWKSGMPHRKVAKLFKVSVAALYRWRDQWQRERTLTCKKGSGRPRKFTAEHEARVAAALEETPTATLAQLIATEDLPVQKTQLAYHLRRMNFTVKKVADEPIDFPNERILEEINTYLDAVKDVPMNKRVYFDESFSYLNEAPARGRAQRGKTARRQREAHAKRYMFALAIRQSGLVHPPAIACKTMTDDVFMSYVRAQLVPHLREGDVVIWDRLGKSGRTKNPTKQREYSVKSGYCAQCAADYNPEARELIEAKGARLVFLPPKGKHFNPIELLFGKAKTHIRNSYTTSLAAREKRHRRDGELIQAIMDGCASITLKDIQGYFRERGGIRAFRKHHPNVPLAIEA
jgi:transposase